MFCLIYALDDCSGFELSTPFKLPTSAFSDKGKDSILNDKELSDSFKSPKSVLNNQELSESFKMPGSQYNNLEYPNISQQNIIKANIVSDIVDYSFWINIYCQNINSML